MVVVVELISSRFTWLLTVWYPAVRLQNNRCKKMQSVKNYL